MYTSEQDSTLSSFRPNTRLVLWEFLIVSFPAIFIFQWLPLQADNTNMQRVFFSWNLLIINSSHVPVMYVLYGTQTGTSRELAQDLTREAQRRGHTVVLQDVADFLPVSTSDVTYRTKTDLPEKKVVIFLCSTTGQGEVPDGMKVKQLLRVIYSPQSFWLFLLRRSLPVTSLQNTSYAVFGLGDSSYVKYNYVSKMLFNRLKQLGGTPLLRRGDGNDQHPFGVYGDFYPWSEELWPKLVDFLPPGVDRSLPLPEKQRPAPCYLVNFVEPSTDEKPPKRAKIDRGATPREEGQADSAYDQGNPFLATLRVNRRITALDWSQDVRHLALDISNSGIRYSTGDVVYIQPSNPPEKVCLFLELLGYNPNTLITKITDQMRGVPGMTHIPLPITLYNLFLDHVDFLGVPSRYFFELLSFFCTDSMHAERLAYLSSKEGYEELYDYSKKAKRTYLDVLKDFPSASIPLDYVFDFFLPLKARPFSISSSQHAFPDEIQVSMVVVQYTSIIKRLKQGLCSTWLSLLDPVAEPVVRLWVKKGTIRFPPPSTPVVMVGPGTGCAIFRAYLQYRASCRAQGQELGKALFFFGCRKEAADFLYAEEWEELVSQEVLSTFAVAFSRDQNRKIYVQDKMQEFGEEIFDVICRNEGCFFLSGRAEKMPQDVRKILVGILREKGNMTEEEAQKYLQIMEQKNRYMTETWA